jgi:hypothetical protein
VVRVTGTFRAIGSTTSRAFAAAAASAAPSAAAAATTMAAVLAAFGSKLLLEHPAHLHADSVMQAVVLSTTLDRTQRGSRLPDRLIGFVVLPAVALVSVGLGTLMRDAVAVGDAGFAVLVTAGVWIRRFGPRFSKAGTLMMLPAIALLVIPHGASGASATRIYWAPVVAFIAYFWVTAAQVAVERPWKSAATDRADKPAPAPTTSKKLPASTRMAAQMGVALSAAFIAGHWLFPDHWSWVVLTAFIVCNGARGRGDAVHKGLLRMLGAAGGTAMAALVAGLFGPRDPHAVALIFVVLGLAAWLRQRSYAFWAGGVTAALSLLYGYFGQSAVPLLQTRLEAIVVGAVIGTAAARFVLSFRTRDVLRRRISESLVALTDVLKDEPGARSRFEESVTEMDKIYGALRLHRFATRTQPHPVEAIDVLRATVPHVRALEPGTGRLRANIGAVRRAVAGRHDGKPYRTLPWDDDAPSARAIDAGLARIHEIYARPVAEPENAPKRVPEPPERTRPAG